MTQHVSSVGHIATVAQVSVQHVRSIIEDVGAKPALVINGVEHYDGMVVGTILCRVNGLADQPAYHRTYHETQQVTS